MKLTTTNDIFKSEEFLVKGDQLIVQKRSFDGTLQIDINLKLYDDSVMLLSDHSKYLYVYFSLFFILWMVFLLAWCTSNNRFSVPIFSLPLIAALPFYITSSIYRILSPNIDKVEYYYQDETFIRCFLPMIIALPCFLICFKQTNPKTVRFSAKKLQEFKLKFFSKKAIRNLTNKKK